MLMKTSREFPTLKVGVQVFFYIYFFMYMFFAVTVDHFNAPLLGESIIFLFFKNNLTEQGLLNGTYSKLLTISVKCNFHQS